MVDCGFCRSSKSKEQLAFEEKNNKVNFYRIPKIVTLQGDQYKELTTERRRRWLSAISRADLTESKLQNGAVCSKHFTAGLVAKPWDKHNIDWVPTLFLGHSKSHKQCDSASSRAERTLNRKRRKVAIDEPNRAQKNVKSSDPVPTTEIDFDQKQHQTRSVSTDTSEFDYMFKDITFKQKPFCEEYFEKDDTKVKFYTGLPSFAVLQIVFSFIEPFIDRKQALLTNFQEFILVLMKLRLNVPNQDLSYRFNVSSSTVTRIFHTWIDVLDKRLSGLIIWPERDDLIRTMPNCFKFAFGNKTTTIIDCFEIFIEKASNLMAKSQTWSNYKHHNTIKVLIGITPQGTISFVSNTWGGRTSDKFLTEHCGFLDKLSPGDLVLADRGFLIHESVQFQRAELAMPAFTKGKNQLDPTDIETTRGIANVRIHVERVIGCLRQKYTILDSTLPITLLATSENQPIPLVDKVVRVCSALINFCPSIVPFD